MNRRNFLSLAALAIAGKAAERVFPFRVYSIPKEIEIARDLPPYPWIQWSRMTERVGKWPYAYISEPFPSHTITPELLRKCQNQLVAALGTKPLKIYSYPLR